MGGGRDIYQLGDRCPSGDVEVNAGKPEQRLAGADLYDREAALADHVDGALDDPAVGQQLHAEPVPAVERGARQHNHRIGRITAHCCDQLRVDDLPVEAKIGVTRGAGLDAAVLKLRRALVRLAQRVGGQSVDRVTAEWRHHHPVAKGPKDIRPRRARFNQMPLLDEPPAYALQVDRITQPAVRPDRDPRG